MLCSIEEIFFKKKRRAELFDYGVAKVMSKVTHMHGVHGVDTMFMFCLVFFGSFKNLIFIHPSSISCVSGTS